MASIKKIYLGATEVDKLLAGTDLVYEKAVADTTPPTTTVYPDPTQTYDAGTKFWLEVNEACDTYYTLDGSTPTTESTLFTEPFILNADTTIKYFSVDLAGNVETVKTTTIDIVATPITSISPTATIQNTIPFTITLTATNSPTATYYRLGDTGTQQTYTAPFSVNQNSAGVSSTQIKVAYWSTNANGTETEKLITYDTSGAVPSKPVVTVTNGENQVILDWAITGNTTSYSIYRSTTSGTLGTVISQYQSANTFTDTTVTGGTTYYYTVQAGNYGDSTDSDQVTALPTEAIATSGWRYLKIEGYGSVEESVTTRIIEFEAWEGTTNRMAGATILSNEAVSYSVGGGTVASIKDAVKTTTGYPLWWTATPNARIVIDLLAERPLTKLNYYSYSVSGVQRTNRFKILASNTNNGTDWVDLWDNSAGQLGAQPILPSGYELIL